LSKGVIEVIADSQVAFLSNIFAKPKPDGSICVILDLTHLNLFVTYKHFKMDSLQTAINLMTPNCYMASVDWKDAYYAVPIAKNTQPLLAFK